MPSLHYLSLSLSLFLSRLHRAHAYDPHLVDGSSFFLSDDCRRIGLGASYPCVCYWPPGVGNPCVFNHTQNHLSGVCITIAVGMPDTCCGTRWPWYVATPVPGARLNASRCAGCGRSGRVPDAADTAQAECETQVLPLLCACDAHSWYLILTFILLEISQYPEGGPNQTWARALSRSQMTRFGTGRW